MKTDKKKSTNSTTRKKTAFLKVFESNLGVITPACKSIGIDRGTYYLWMEKDAEFAAACQHIQESAIDFAESTLFKQMKKGDTTAAIFYLKTKGRRRGYSQTDPSEAISEISITLKQSE